MQTPRKRILLVSPRSPTASYTDLRASEFLARSSGGVMNASLPTLAALTPGEFEVRIVDENAASVDLDAPWDIAGITGLPTQFFRARELARELSRRGALVVCGGPSVTLAPERWRPFADVLFIGEAERTWPRFLRDYLAGSFADEYRESERFDLAESPIPDYTGMPKSVRKRFMMGLVQASRGCPYDCEFCSVGEYVGRKMRYKSADRVVQEVEALSRAGIGIVILADDNLTGDRNKAKAIVRALGDWNRRRRNPVLFGTQVSIDIARDDEFLELAAEAGLTTVSVGIESPNPESLREAGKRQNLASDMLADIKKFHQHGIAVVSNSIVGFDHDDLSIFQDQLDFHMKSGITNVQIFPLQALDGSAIKDRMIRAGRYLDWEERLASNPERFHNLSVFTIKPKQMSIEQLQAGTYWLLWKLYDHENYFSRLKGFFTNYETSPKRGQLAIPRFPLDAKRIGILLKLLWYLLRASRTDRRYFWKMIGLSRQSSHPQRLGVAIIAFITLINVRSFLLANEPGIAGARDRFPTRADRRAIRGAAPRGRVRSGRDRPGGAHTGLAERRGL